MAVLAHQPQPLSIPSPSSNSDTSTAPPVTPSSPNQSSSVTPTSPETINGTATANANKRKTSRRANTAERRATHNAVERQRRETLNGRFLDLASLLPTLSQIRRPSKSAIVTSSIAFIHASRRHRMLASRELRLLKLESDAQRRELNEWRDRAGLPRVEEPIRGEGFGIILGGELEIVGLDPNSDNANNNSNNFDGAGDDGELLDDDDGEAPMMAYATSDISMDLGMAEEQMMMQNPFAHNVSNTTAPMTIPQPSGRPAAARTSSSHSVSSNRGANGSPAIMGSSPSVSYENPAMAAMYEPMHPSSYGSFPNPGLVNHFQAQQLQQQQLHLAPQFNPAAFMQQQNQNGFSVADKYASQYNAFGGGNNMRQQQPMTQQQLMAAAAAAQRALFTPPSSAHGLPSPSFIDGPGADPHAFMARYSVNGGYGSEGDDAASSVSSHSGVMMPTGRDRSGSLGNRSVSSISGGGNRSRGMSLSSRGVGTEDLVGVVGRGVQVGNSGAVGGGVGTNGFAMMMMG